VLIKNLDDADLLFLILKRYVPNVVKRSIWDHCKKYILRTDRRSTSHLGKF